MHCIIYRVSCVLLSHTLCFRKQVLNLKFTLFCCQTIENSMLFCAFCASVPCIPNQTVSSTNTTETIVSWMRDGRRYRSQQVREGNEISTDDNIRRWRVARMCFYLFILWMMSVRLWKGFWDMISVDLLTFFIYFLCYLLSIMWSLGSDMDGKEGSLMGLYMHFNFTYSCSGRVGIELDMGGLPDWKPWTFCSQITTELLCGWKLVLLFRKSINSISLNYLEL